ncbi:MAG: polysaccharide deacetylase family protein [Planctomycetes bacterium]|nr:polysaccharide deacetylase family protein [Planctomycetota bacterium]
MINPAGTGNAATYDGTSARASFYVLGEKIQSDASLGATIFNAYQLGHEIGNHTFDHVSSTDDAGWRDQISRTNAQITGLGIPATEIYGFRSPFDAYNTALFPVLRDLGFTYDCSMPIGWSDTFDGTNGYCPFTLDTAPPIEPWQQDPGIHPGVWEVPEIVPVLPLDLGGGKIGYCDKDWFWTWRNEPNEGAANIERLLKHNLDVHLSGNRAPLNLCFHSQDWNRLPWQTVPPPEVAARQQALINFVAYAVSKPEVRVVRAIDVVNWMRNPTALGAISPPNPGPEPEPEPEPQPQPTPPPSGGGKSGGRCGAVGLEAILLLGLLAGLRRLHAGLH